MPGITHSVVATGTDSGTWHLVINPGVDGSEETVARGAWIVVARDG